MLILESARPSAIRREVSFCEAVYDGEAFVEGVLSHRIQDVSECAGIWEMGEIPLLVDETGEAIKKLSGAVIDAILAKKKSWHKQGDGASYHSSGTWISGRYRCGLCSGNTERS